MKTLVFITLLIINGFLLEAKTGKTDFLQFSEAINPAGQNPQKTATLKASSRLFASKYDLTSVIVIIPAGSVVSVLDADSAYYHITFEDNEGYIYKRQAVIDKVPAKITRPEQPEPPASDQQVQQTQPDDRFTYLENKYGTTMAERLYAGKIWKGMNSEMVKDSWGTADKINRVIDSNIITEEWTYKNTWLYFENNTLLQWGPVKK